MSWPHVDWAQAPKDAVAWYYDEFLEGVWVKLAMNIADQPYPRGFVAPDFNYTGHPRDSLTLRPQEETTK